MSQFNLIDERWIPVRLTDGRREELGIRDTLLRAREIAAIEDPSPLVTAALHRFLLAVLYRALEGPADIDQAKALFRSGLPGEKITAYLAKWRDRFWLLHDDHPFGQIPTFEPKTWRAWTVLAAEHNADNAKVLFDHVNVEEAGTVTFAAAARWLLATQTFSVSAGKTELAHSRTAPSATAVMALPLGLHLEDTLLYCLVPQNAEIASQDRPIWERNPEDLGKLREGMERPAAGFSDRYTWRIRTVRLLPEGAGRVARLAFASGVGCSSTEQVDPMLGYRIDEKNGRLPVQLRERGLWRDFDSLLPDESHLAPRVLEHATALARPDRGRFPRSVLVLGQSNNKAKIEYWRMERFTLPRALAGNRPVRTEIHHLLAEAEEAQKHLWAACCAFARDQLSRSDERTVSKKDINAFVEQMIASPRYWSDLEIRFHEILDEYALDRDPDDIRRLWLTYVRDALRTAWDQHRASVSMGDAWTIRAVVRAEVPIHRKTRELNEEIAKLTPKKEGP